MIDTQAIQRWLEYADNDMKTAEFLLGMHPQPYEHICFHSQQAAEKAVKALLVCTSISPPRLHDLATLLDTCIVVLEDDSLEKLREPCERLTPFAVQPRYPMEIEITSAHMMQAVKDARGILTTLSEKCKSLMNQKEELSVKERVNEAKTEADKNRSDIDEMER